MMNELTRRRLQKFKKDKLAVFSCWLLLLLFFLSFTAEFWSNSKPHFLKYQGKFYAPMFVNYHPSVFGRDDIMVMDYRELKLGAQDWAIWPLIKWDPYESNKSVETYPSPPTKDNLLGTDDRGRDVFARLLYGLRYTLIYAIGCWFLTYLVGVIIGSVMGYFGGWFDLLSSRAIEVVETMPRLIILITMISIFEPSLPMLICFTVIFDWTMISAYMRGQFLSLRRREFVEAAKAIGAGHSRIMFKHIMPNALTPIVTFAPFTIAANVSSLAILDFLGLGLRPPTPSWGELLVQAQKYFTTAEWLVWAPSGILLVTLTLLINIGLAIRDAFDSKF